MGRKRTRWPAGIVKALQIGVYLAVELLRLILLLLPIDLNLRASRWLGRLWAIVQSSRYRLAVDQIRQSLGEGLTPDQTRTTALRSMQNFVRMGIELFQSPRLIRRWTWSRYTRLHPSIDPVIRLAMERQPAILVTGHFGQFELLGQLLACCLGKFTAVARSMDNPYLDDLLVRTRRHCGLELIFKRGATDAVEDVLRRGEMLGEVIDQDAGRKGFFVDFFGRKASTHKSVALLAVEYEVPVIVGYCRRLGDHFEFELAAERIIQPAEWKGRDDAPIWITQEYMKAIESFARRWPEQYLWTHRRWKTRPKNERPKNLSTG